MDSLDLLQTLKEIHPKNKQNMERAVQLMGNADPSKMNKI